MTGLLPSPALYGVGYCIEGSKVLVVNCGSVYDNFRVPRGFRPAFAVVRLVWQGWPSRQHLWQGAVLLVRRHFSFSV